MGWRAFSTPLSSLAREVEERRHMGGMTRGYFLRRILIFFLTIWVAASIIWVIPRLAPGDPITAMVNRMVTQGGYIRDSQAIIDGWKARFGLNDPLPVQYVRYLTNI